MEPKKWFFVLAMLSLQGCWNATLPKDPKFRKNLVTVGLELNKQLSFNKVSVELIARNSNGSVNHEFAIDVVGAEIPSGTNKVVDSIARMIGAHFKKNTENFNDFDWIKVSFTQPRIMDGTEETKSVFVYRPSEFN